MNASTERSRDGVAALIEPEASIEAADALFLRDGGRLSLRQIGHADRDGLATLFARLSPESRHRRFLSPKRELTPRELAFFTDIDHIHHEAIAAVDQRDGSIVGIVRDVQHPDRAGVADVAIEVADAFHRMGIGTALAGLAIQHAHANGFTLLTATTLWENRAARMLLRRNGFRARHTHGGEIEHELKLEAVGLSPQRCVAGGHEDPQADESSAEVIGACTTSLPSATACHPWPKPVAYPEIRSLNGYAFPGGRS